MRLALRNALVCLPLACLGGCSWFPYLVMNLVGRPVEFTQCCCLHLEASALADHAWEEIVAGNHQSSFSRGYADGFHDGFVDYVKRNDTGEPPAIPPYCYRCPVLRTPEQQQLIDDWFAGFRHGAQVARQDRWRDGVVIPISKPPMEVFATFSRQLVPTPPADAPTGDQADKGGKAPATPPQYEELPAPRPPAKLPPANLLEPKQESVRLGAPLTLQPRRDDREGSLTGTPSLGLLVEPAIPTPKR